MPPQQLIILWGGRILGTLLVAVLAWLAMRYRRALFAMLLRRGWIDPHRAPHAEALLSASSRWVILSAAALAALAVLGADLAKVLTGASILGLALGLGAQGAVRDLIAGFFIMLEDQYRPGDYVQVNGEMEGLVETLNLRVTKLRGWDGTLLSIGNAGVLRVRNYNRDAMRVIIEAAVPFAQDHARVRQVIEQLCAEMAKTHREHLLAEDGVLLEPPFLYGIVDIASARGIGATYCIMALTQVESYWFIAREIRRLVLERFQAEGISLSYPQRVFHEP
jgi:small-conductance mechanosensitive channel